VNKSNPVLVAVAATVCLGVALVFGVRSLIPSGEPQDLTPSQPAQPAPEALSATADTTRDDAAAPGASLPVHALSLDANAVPVAAAAPAAPVANTVEPQSINTAALTPAVAEATATPTVTAGPIEPLATIRADMDRLRARVDALNASGDAGPGGALRRPMLALVQGSQLVRRLSAGDPTFADELARYRAALADAGVLDPASREALRGSIFSPGYAERASSYDELLQMLR
jgi:hypothetical protein